MAWAGLLAGDLEGLVDLDGDPLAAGRGQVGLVDAVGVGLDPQDGRPRVPGQRRRLDLGGGVAGEQVLVRPLAPGLVDVAARPPRVPASTPPTSIPPTAKAALPPQLRQPRRSLLSSTRCLLARWLPSSRSGDAGSGTLAQPSAKLAVP